MLGHELTHIRNGDVRMMVIAVIIAGVISFFAELFFRMFFHSGGSYRSSGSSSSQRPQGRRRGVAILIAIALIALAWLLSIVIRLALSRSREFLADAGSVELTKNPDAMISALAQDRGPRRIAGRDLGRDGNVRRQSARGICRPVRDASVGRPPRRCAGEVRRRARSGPARAAFAEEEEPGIDSRTRSRPPPDTERNGGMDCRRRRTGRTSRRASGDRFRCRPANRTPVPWRRRRLRLTRTDRALNPVPIDAGARIAPQGRYSRARPSVTGVCARRFELGVHAAMFLGDQPRPVRRAESAERPQTPAAE